MEIHLYNVQILIRQTTLSMKNGNYPLLKKLLVQPKGPLGGCPLGHMILWVSSVYGGKFMGRAMEGSLLELLKSL